MHAGAAQNGRSKEYQITAAWKPEFQLIGSQLTAPAQEPFVSKCCDHKPPANCQSSLHTQYPLTRHPELHKDCNSVSRSPRYWHISPRLKVRYKRKKPQTGLLWANEYLPFSSSDFVPGEKQNQQNHTLQQGFISCWCPCFPAPQTFPRLWALLKPFTICWVFCFHAFPDSHLTALQARKDFL